MNLKTMPGVHIYTLSRLVHAPASTWERRIEKIEEGRRSAYGYYQPMREAVAAFCATKGMDRDRIVTRMLAQAQEIPHRRGQNPERDNLRAFEIFEASCYRKIDSFVSSLLRRPQGQGVNFGDVVLRGAPHLKVTDKDRQTCYVFLYASKWEEQDLKAYIELLSIVVEIEFGAPATSIWHMDLRSGRVSKYRSRVRMRQRCIDAARHYARVCPARN